MHAIGNQQKWLIMHHCENFCSAIASALAKQEAVLSQLHEDLNMKTDNLQVNNSYFIF